MDEIKQPAGGAGGENTPLPSPIKVTKLSIPEAKRSMSFGDRFGWFTVSAGIEVKFTEEVSINSPEVEKAFKYMREEIRKEFKHQYDHYKAQLNNANSEKKEVSSK